MKNCFSFLLLLFSLLISTSAAAQVFEWAKPFRGQLVNSETDQNGNTYVLGKFYDSLTIGSVAMASPQDNYYLAKYTDAGSVEWVRHYPVTYIPHPANPNINVATLILQGFTIDQFGNYFIHGRFGSSANIGSAQLTDPSGAGFILRRFLIKFSDSGSVLWSKQSAATDGFSVSHLKTDYTGNLFIIGTKDSASTTFAGQSLPSSGDHLVKFSQAGAFLWAKPVSFGVVWYLTTDGAGNLYITGSGATVFGNGVQLAPGSFYSFVAKYSSSGFCSWASGINAVTDRLFSNTNASGTTSLTGYYPNIGNVSGGYFGNFYVPGSPYLQNSSGSTSFVAQLDSAGTFTWAKGLGTNGYSRGYSVVTSPTGEVFVLANFFNSLKIGSFPNFYTTSPATTAIEDSDGLIIKYSSTGAEEWVEQFGGPNYETPYKIMLSTAGNLYITSKFGQGGQSHFFTPAVCHLGDITIQANAQGNAYGHFLAKLIQPANRISGRVFIDQNSSGSFDAGDSPVPNLSVGIQPGGSPLSTNLQGKYGRYTNSGPFSIFLPNVPPYYTVQPAIHSAMFFGVGQTDTTNHFALQPLGNFQDLKIEIIPTGKFSPGAYRHLLVSYRNEGTTSMNGSVQLAIDPNYLVQSSTPAVASTTGNVLTWNFSNLQPFESRIISIWSMVHYTTPIGTPLSFTAQVNPVPSDQTPANNTSVLNTTVVGSFDPNDKLVSHETLTLSEALAQQPLTYTVRFQNTGNAPATTVTIRDSLSFRHDLFTLEFIASSHPCTWSFVNPTLLEWRFPGIVLPDSVSNEPESHGFVHYRLKPKNNLMLGQQIKTRAHIYFDFNLPVATNLATTTVTQFTSAPEPNKALQLHLYPNPNTGRFTLTAQVQPGPVHIRLKNVLGQTVQQLQEHVAGDELRLDICSEHLPAGVYLVELNSSGKRSIQRVVLQR